MSAENEIFQPTWAEIVYYLISGLLGSVMGLAALLGSSEALTRRNIFLYLITGGMVALCVVLLTVAKYGYTPFLLGVSICAGYKAFDVFILLGNILKKIAQTLGDER